MQVYGWELLAVCDHRHFDSGYIMFLICSVASCEHMFKAIHEFMGGNPSHLEKLGGHWSCASGDINYLICQVTS